MTATFNQEECKQIMSPLDTTNVSSTEEHDGSYYEGEDDNEEAVAATSKEEECKLIMSPLDTTNVSSTENDGSYYEGEDDYDHYALESGTPTPTPIPIPTPIPTPIPILGQVPPQYTQYTQKYAKTNNTKEKNQKRNQNADELGAERQRKRRSRYRSSMLCNNHPLQPSVGSFFQFTHNPEDPISDLCRTLPRRKLRLWGKVLSIDHLRVVSQVAFWAVDNKPMASSLRTTLHIKPTHEVRRLHHVVVHNKNTSRWEPIYEIKPSLIPNSGEGLFAMRNFAAGDCMGVYYGQVLAMRHKNQYSRHAMVVSRPSLGSTENYIVEQFGLSPNREDICCPCYFGLHFANDPNFQPPSSSSSPSSHSSSAADAGAGAAGAHHMYNMVVNEDLFAFATRDISVGEEIYMNYNLLY